MVGYAGYYSQCRTLLGIIFRVAKSESSRAVVFWMFVGDIRVVNLTKISKYITEIDIYSKYLRYTTSLYGIAVVLIGLANMQGA